MADGGRRDRGPRPLVELTRARWVEYTREPATLFWVFAFPILLFIGLGIAFREQPPEPARVGIEAAQAGAERLTALLGDAPELAVEVLPAPEATRALERGALDIIARWSDGAAPEIAYRYDPNRPDSQRARLVVDDVLQRRLGREDPARIREETARRPGGRYIDWLLPGLIGINLMGTSLWSIGWRLTQFRRAHLLRALAVTPMRRWQFLTSYLLVRLVFLVPEVTVLMATGALAFGVALQGSALAIALISLVGALSFAGLGLLCGSRTANAETAGGLMNVIMLPMWLVSGVFFSYERFPEALHPLIEALPLTALNNALRAVYNDAASLTEILPELGILSAWGVAGFGVALKIFRWQ